MVGKAADLEEGKVEKSPRSRPRLVCILKSLTALTCCILRPRASLVTRLTSASSLLPSLITTESSEGLRGSGEVFVTSSRGGTLDRESNSLKLAFMIWCLKYKTTQNIL